MRIKEALEKNDIIFTLSNLSDLCAAKVIKLWALFLFPDVEIITATDLSLLMKDIKGNTVEVTNAYILLSNRYKFTEKAIIPVDKIVCFYRWEG